MKKLVSMAGQSKATADIIDTSGTSDSSHDLPVLFA